MTAAALPEEDPADLPRALKGNICRCTGYGSIADALAGPASRAAPRHPARRHPGPRTAQQRVRGQRVSRLPDGRPVTGRLGPARARRAGRGDRPGPVHAGHRHPGAAAHEAGAIPARARPDPRGRRQRRAGPARGGRGVQLRRRPRCPLLHRAPPPPRRRRVRHPAVRPDRPVHRPARRRGRRGQRAHGRARVRRWSGWTTRCCPPSSTPTARWRPARRCCTPGSICGRARVTRNGTLRRRFTAAAGISPPGSRPRTPRTRRRSGSSGCSTCTWRRTPRSGGWTGGGWCCGPARRPRS